MKAVFLGCVAALLLCSAAHAQTAPSAVDPKGCAPGERLQTDGSTPKTPEAKANEPLSDKLARTDGVLCPPNVDPEIKAPTLVVIGDRDTPGNRQGAELVASKVPGANKRVIPGADHGVPVGWSDELISAAIGFMRAARR